MTRWGPVAWVGAISLAGLGGCTSMSGYDAKDSFSCKAPDGVLCSSMTGIYANAQQNNLPGQQVHQREVLAKASVRETVMTQPIHSGTPIRSAPRILRVWFAPWEDSDGDLHDQSYVYLPVDTGKWQIEHNQRRIQDTYRPVRPPVATVSPPHAGPNVAATQTGTAPAEGAPQFPASPQVAAELLEALRARAPRATSAID